MRRSFKERVSAVGLSYVKEVSILIILIIIFLGGAFAIYYFLKELYFALIFLVAGVVVIYFYLSRYQSLEKQQEKDHVNELISLLNYFELFISNKNNVYISFKLLLPYSSTFMDEAISSLLNQIDTDKSVGPFINFASKFNSRIVDSLMLSIYQMVDTGENDNQFSEFELLFTNVRERYQDELVENKRKSLESMNVFPLFGAGLITICLSMSLIQIIGDYINVI